MWALPPLAVAPVLELCSLLRRASAALNKSLGLAKGRALFIKKPRRRVLSLATRMATSAIGAFDDAVESWAEYQERLEEHFLAKDIDDDTKKRATLMSVCGRKTFQIARSLCAPDKVATKKYSEICALLSGHFNPKPSQIAQRFHFNNRLQKSGESVSEFLAELQKLSERCDYGDSLKDMIRDRQIQSRRSPNSAPSAGGVNSDARIS